MLGSAALRRAHRLSRTRYAARTARAARCAPGPGPKVASALRSIIREPQKRQETARPLQPVPEPRAAALLAIPTADLCQKAAMLSPTSLVSGAQLVGFVVAVARVLAARCSEQAQSTDPTATPEGCRERIQPAIARPRRVHTALLILAQKNAGSALLCERHQRMPPFAIEQHQAPGFPREIDFACGHPGDDLRSRAARGVDQAPQIRIGQRNAQIAAAIAATRAAKSQMAEAARHRPSLPQFLPACSEARRGPQKDR